MRKLAMRTAPKLVRVNKKADRRERNRERKALVAADLEKSIKKELLERLRKGTYGDIYNFPEKEYEKALEEADGEMDEMGEDLAAEEDDELEAEEFEADLDDNSEDDEVEYLEEDEFMESDDELEDAGLSFEVSHSLRCPIFYFLGQTWGEIISWRFRRLHYFSALNWISLYRIPPNVGWKQTKKISWRRKIEQEIK